MDAIKNFVSELLYLCSSSNEGGSRGFYIFVTAALAIVAVLTVVLVGLNVFMLIKGWWNIIYLILLVAAAGLEAGAIFWLNKS